MLPTVANARSGSALLDMLRVDRGGSSPLRYEDLTSDRFVELRRLSTELGFPVNMSRISDESVTFAPNHLVGGDPVRFHWEMAIRRDEEWVSAMPPSTKLLVGTAPPPPLSKWGYWLSSPSARACR
jgi:hypothetical protein